MSIGEISEETTQILNTTSSEAKSDEKLNDAESAGKEAPIRTSRTSKDTARKVRAEHALQAGEAQWIIPPSPEALINIEKGAIKEDPRLKELIGEDAIISIEKVEDGKYHVLTENHRVEVTVENLPMKYCGVPEFNLHFGEALPR